LLQLLPKSWAQRFLTTPSEIVGPTIVWKWRNQHPLDTPAMAWSLKPSMPVVLLFCYNSFRNRGTNDCSNVEKSTQSRS
jgi:hypothetical protein